MSGKKIEAKEGGIELFLYEDFRKYLLDYYDDQKKRRTGFTYANFAKKIGLKSPNYYKLVMDGEKNLTPENVVRFASGLNFDESETDFFETLVNYNQAKVEIEKNFYRERLAKIKGANARKNDIVLKGEHFESISHWMFHAVYVLSQTPGWSEDAEKVKKQLFEVVSVEDVKYAIETLKRVELIGDEKNEVDHVQTEPEISRFSAKSFYQSLLGRACKMFDLTEANEREVSCCAQ